MIQPSKKIIAVIGATPIGLAIAAFMLRAGHRVVLEDVSEARLQAVSTVTLNLSFASTVEDAIREADFIVETLADDVEMKIELFTLFDKFAKPGSIFATTGSISVDELAEITFCPERCIAVRVELDSAMHKFEVVAGRQTSQETVERCDALFRGFGSG